MLIGYDRWLRVTVICVVSRTRDVRPVTLLRCNAYIALIYKIRRKRSQQSSSSRQREFSAQNNNTENDYEYIKNSDRGSASVDDRGNLCKRSVAELGGLESGFFSGAIPRPRCPEWRRADNCRQNGP